MAAPIALQLHSIRKELGNDFEASVRRIAEMGYVGVETAGFSRTIAEKAGKVFRDLGLAVTGAHVPVPVGETKQQTLDVMNAIGSKRIISGLGPKDFETMDLIKKSCEAFNEANSVAVENGMTFGIHNHEWEFLPIDDRYVYQVMIEHLAPEIFFEVDTYWVKTAGRDPADVIRELGARAPLLHIKDGPCEKKKAMTAVGDGIVDFHGIVKAGGTTPEWMIVELDRCDTDMMEAVEKSYAYLIGEALAQGKK